jgi:small subunit ribosomal protein S2
MQEIRGHQLARVAPFFMQEITLQQLLEAGCHFGHKSERWNPKAGQFIFTEKDGIHVIDLAKTKAGLDDASEFAKDLLSHGGELLFVATKRQAMGVVREAAERAGAPYLVERWIGGFLTNWEEVKKNIDKINRLEEEKATGKWKGMPKHEQGKLTRYIERLKVFYGGVLQVKGLPNALFVVDVKRERAAVREAMRVGIPVIAIVDTNSDPTGIEYVIPANDDAVGSVKLICDAIASSYSQGREARTKDTPPEKPAHAPVVTTAATPATEPTAPVVARPPTKTIAGDAQAVAPKKKRGRPKKSAAVS